MSLIIESCDETKKLRYVYAIRGKETCHGRDIEGYRHRNGHKTLNDVVFACVDATLPRRIDLSTASFRRHVPAGVHLTLEN